MLPLEIWEMIMEHLCLRDIISLKKVCMETNELISAEPTLQRMWDSDPGHFQWVWTLSMNCGLEHVDIHNSSIKYNKHYTELYKRLKTDFLTLDLIKGLVLQHVRPKINFKKIKKLQLIGRQLNWYGRSNGTEYIINKSLPEIHTITTWHHTSTQKMPNYSIVAYVALRDKPFANGFPAVDIAVNTGHFVHRMSIKREQWKLTLYSDQMFDDITIKSDHKILGVLTYYSKDRTF